jgi:hypothetical protein
MAEQAVTPKPSENPKGPGRIPLRKIWLREPIDLPFHNGVSQIDCSPAKPGREFYVAHFVPSHQTIELEWYKNETSEPHRTRLTLSLVTRFD